MFPIEAFRNTILKAVRLFERHSISYHLTGGITTAAFVEPRMTQDVDIVVDPVALSRSLREFLIDARAAGFTFHEESVVSAVARRALFQFLDEQEILKLDLYPRELIPGELSRSIRVELFAGTELPIASRADATLSKLVWVSRGSHKNRRDVRQLVATLDAVERERVDVLARELGLTALLTAVLAEPDEVGD